MFDWSIFSKIPNKLETLVKYLVEGIVVTFVAFYLTGRLNETHSIIRVSLTVSILLATIDALWPDHGSFLRRSLVAATAWYFIHHPVFCKDTETVAGMIETTLS